MNSFEKRKPQPWYRYITVEPTMFLYMSAHQLTSVVEQELLKNKACIVNHNVTEVICQNLNDFPDIHKNVQITVSTFHQWNFLARCIFSVVIALFIGSWSDRRGRKLPLLIGLTGKLIYISGILLNIEFDKWPLEYIIFTATIPSALTGIDITVFATNYSYISDVSSNKHRTLRIAILDFFYLVALPIGKSLGSFLFYNVVGHSYFTMYCINAGLLLAAIFYSILNLEWQTSPMQTSMSKVGCNGIVGDFFDKQHVVDTVRMLFRKRTNHRRVYLWTILTAMFFYSFPRDERLYKYLYTGMKFGWKVKEFTNFDAFSSVMQSLMVFCGVPLMTELFKWKETLIAMIGATCYASARLFYAFAEIPEVFYLGAAVSGVGAIGGPMLRTLTSRVISVPERGKAFVVLSVFGNAVPFVSSILYSQVFNLTVGGFPGIYVLSFASQIALLNLILVLHFVFNGKELNDDTDNEDTSSVDDMKV